MLLTVRKILVLFFIFCVLPVFANEDEQNSDIELKNEENKEETVENNSGRKILSNRLQLSPKREQQKTLSREAKNLEKNKKQFNDLKNNQLRLLRGEYEILEYHP